MLNVLCLSLVPVLRCAVPNRIEFSALLIPPGIELLFSVVLLWKRDDQRGRYYHLLCAEGISYFLLALVDFLTRVVTILQQDLSAAKITDLVIGGLSLVPLLCFVLWFYLTARENLLHIIPARLRKLTGYFLISFIPLVIASNAAGAFVGISYRIVDGEITVGFLDERARLLWSVFNMLSLGLLAVFQAMAFLLLLARLIKAVRHKRRRQLVSGTEEVYHFGGIVFINLGMLLSLVDILVGFVPQSLALAIIRRGTKCAGRVLIMSGVLNGWDYVEDVRFVLQAPPKPKRISKLSIRQLFPSARTPSDESQTSERLNGRVSVRHLRGRAPTLHLRLSELDVDMKSFRSPTRSPNSLHMHLIPQALSTGSPVEISTSGHPDVQDLYHRNVPVDVPTTPLTPHSPWFPTSPTHKASSSTISTNRTAGPPSPNLSRDERSPYPTHAREDTVSSTLSQLPAEVMTLSESPPDPGFVLPIPSRSRIRHSFNLPQALEDLRSTRDSMFITPTRGFEYTEDTVVGREPSLLASDTPQRYTPSVYESAASLSSLRLPQSRRSSWVSESSDVSSAIISTAAKLTRSNTIRSVTSVAARRSPAAIPEEGEREGQENTVASENLPDSALSLANLEHQGNTI